MTSIGRRARNDLLGFGEGCWREVGWILVKEFWRYWGCKAAAPSCDDDVYWNWVGGCGKGGVRI